MLKKLFNRWAWVGQVVHETIADYFRKSRAGLTPTDPEIATENALVRMRRQFAASKALTHRQRPGKFGLVEHEHGLEVAPDQWRAMAEQVRKAINNFYISPAIADLRLAVPDSILAVDSGFETFPLRGVGQAYANVDLALQANGDQVRLVDWKTGRARQSHTLQMMVYALYAAHKWKPGLDHIRPMVVHLETGDVRETPVSPELLDKARQRVSSDLTAMRGLLDRSGNTVPELSCQANPGALCPTCNFRPLCEAVAG
jgi:predicted RecB family nuclease